MAQAKSCAEMSLQEQLEEQIREKLQLLEVNGKLLAENKALEGQLKQAEEARMAEFAARTMMEDKMMRLKAMMWDVEHPEFR